MSIDNEKLSELMKDGWSYPIKTEAGVYERICTITLAENAAIYTAVEPDRTPYNFSRVFIKLTSTGPQPAMTWQFDKNTGGSRAISGYLSAQSSDGTSYAGIHIWTEGGYWTGELYTWRTVASTYGTTQHIGNDNMFYTSDDINIKAIRCGQLNAGLTMEIWAVRAKK